MSEKEIKVSITSLAYNQENYIATAIESFVSQITDFEFEILINDDCSTDRTAEIIKEYEARYPGKVIGVYHDETRKSFLTRRQRRVLSLLPRSTTSSAVSALRLQRWFARTSPFLLSV